MAASATTSTAHMAKYVYDFSEGGMAMNDLLGGKGANLAEMAKLGLPVPPGFTITTEACRHYLAGGTLPDGLEAEVEEHLGRLEAAAGRRLGDPDDPLLVSVRSGARFSMPGMMDTVLDLGLNDRSVLGLAKQSGSQRFAWDSYRRFVSMFASTVLGVSAQLFAGALDRLKSRRTAASDLELDAEDLSSLTREFLSIVLAETGRPFPSDPRRQLSEAILAVFGSWKGERARLYRRLQHIADDLGTAVNVVTMVYGNLGMDSGTGVAFTRDPSTGRRGVYGDYLPDAQGEDVVAGIRNTMQLQDLEDLNPTAYAGLLEAMSTLETHYRDLCDIEFTIERSKLFILQTRIGKRTPAAAFRIACQLVDEGTINLDEALGRVDGHGLVTLMFPSFDGSADAVRLTTGTPASPGAAVGKVALDSATAVRRADDGDQVILVRRETNPDDLAGMVAAAGILTSRGGKTSHAAVVARGMGKTCVVAAEDLSIDLKTRSLHLPSGAVVAEGEVISIDGGTGAVYLGAVPVVASPVVRFFEGSLPESERDDLVEAVERLVRHADSRRRLSVRANADTPADAARSRRFGAEGIGLCRTEHMFLGERRKVVEQLILADSPQAQREALDQLLPLQRGDFVEMLEAMDGLPVTVRLIDPPLHEFLPDLTELSVRVALARLQHVESAGDERLLVAVRRLHEQNPNARTSRRAPRHHDPRADRLAGAGARRGRGAADHRRWASHHRGDGARRRLGERGRDRA